MQDKLISASTQYSLGDASRNVVSVITFSSVGLTATCSVIPKARVDASGQTGTSWLVTIPYLNMSTGAVVAAGTAITADGLYQVKADGLEIVLDATVSSGTAVVYYWPLEGPSTLTSSAAASSVSITSGGNTAGVAAANTAPTSAQPSLVVSLSPNSTTTTASPNVSTTLLASAARTTTQTSADQSNPNGRGIQVILDMTTVGTGSVTLTINGKDPASGKYYLLLSGAAVVTNTTNVYRVFPGATAAANSVANDFLPKTFQIVTTANNANSATYSVGYNILN